MPLADDHGPVGLRVPGLYDRIKTYELSVAFTQDPRLTLGGLPADERAALTYQTQAPTALNQVESLMTGLPIVVPRWYLHEHRCPGVREWAPYRDCRQQFFIVAADDILTAT